MIVGLLKKNKTIKKEKKRNSKKIFIVHSSVTDF